MLRLILLSVWFLFLGNFQAKASMPDFDTDFFKDIKNIVISVGPTPYSPEQVLPLSNLEINKLALEYFARKFPASEGYKIYSRDVARLTRFEDYQYNKTLHISIFLSWRDIVHNDSEVKADIMAMGINLMRYYINIPQSAYIPYGRRSNDGVTPVPYPILITNDPNEFQKELMLGIQEKTDWMVPWIKCQQPDVDRNKCLGIK